jgi:hypothetical protein
MESAAGVNGSPHLLSVDRSGRLRQVVSFTPDVAGAAYTGVRASPSAGLTSSSRPHDDEPCSPVDALIVRWQPGRQAGFEALTRCAGGISVGCVAWIDRGAWDVSVRGNSPPTHRLQLGRPSNTTLVEVTSDLARQATAASPPGEGSERGSHLRGPDPRHREGPRRPERAQPCAADAAHAVPRHDRRRGREPPP